MSKWFSAVQVSRKRQTAHAIYSCYYFINQEKNVLLMRFQSGGIGTYGDYSHQGTAISGEGVGCWMMVAKTIG